MGSVKIMCRGRKRVTVSRNLALANGERAGPEGGSVPRLWARRVRIVFL